MSTKTPASTKSKIKKLSINSFRGIPKSLTLNFESSQSKKPISMLIIGDNGTGKSSIIDAIEFGLQARIGKQKSLTNALASSPLSYASNEIPSIRIELEDDQIVERSLKLINTIPMLTNSRAHNDYSFAAFVLRRSDITKFLETSSEQRQLMFLDYIGSKKGKEWNGAFEENSKIISDQKQQIINSIEKELTELCQLYKWEVPTNIREQSSFDGFIRKKLYKGLKPEEAAKLGNRIKIKPDTNNYIVSISTSLKEYKKVNRLSKASSRPKVEFNSTIQTLRKVLLDASKILTESFLSISKNGFVEKIEIASTTDQAFSLHVIVHLLNGKTCSPKQIFSEANQDLLALLLFLSLIEEAHNNGQAPCLILDDVFQSVDSVVRVAVMEFVVTRFTNWQLIITTHDRLWYSQVKSILGRKNHEHLDLEIIDWNFENGPVISGTRTEDTAALGQAIDRGEVITICSLAGLIHEGVSDKLSCLLPVSVIRRFGDRYTLGDLWPSVSKTLKKTNISSIVEEVDRWVHLRNIAGAHYNEWARSLSTTEAKSYGQAVLNLIQSIQCNKCGHWIEKVGKANRWECRCGAINIS